MSNPSRLSAMLGGTSLPANAVLLLAGLLGCVGIQRLGPARAACPAPRLRTGDWIAITDSGGVTFRLPPGFRERATDAAFREWVLNGDFLQGIVVGYIASSSPPAVLGRAPSPGMVEMTQCVDSIGSREVLVQAWRTRGGTFGDGRRLDRYEVFAVVPVRADLRFYLTGGGDDRRTQEIALAAVRTIVVGAASTSQRERVSS